jgi:hypothetical protein
MPWALAIAELVDANVAAVRGDSSATTALTAAEQALIAADMHLYAAVTRYRRGQLTAGDEGIAAAAAARDELRALGAREPDRIAGMIMPGIAAR